MRFAALAGFPLVETQRNQLSSANMKYRIFHAAIFSNKFQISANGGAQPRWNKNGKEIFYVSLDSKMMATPVKLSPDGQSLETGTPVVLFPVRIAGGPLRRVGRWPSGLFRISKRRPVEALFDGCRWHGSPRFGSVTGYSGHAILVA